VALVRQDMGGDGADTIARKTRRVVVVSSHDTTYLPRKDATSVSMGAGITDSQIPLSDVKVCLEKHEGSGGGVHATCTRVKLYGPRKKSGDVKRLGDAEEDMSGEEVPTRCGGFTR